MLSDKYMHKSIAINRMYRDMIKYFCVMVYFYCKSDRNYTLVAAKTLLCCVYSLDDELFGDGMRLYT